MPLVRFRAPGNLEDLPPASPFHDRWHDLVAGLIRTRTSPSGSGEYVDPSQVDVAASATRAYTWTGFPRPLLMKHRDDRRAAFAAGEDRDAQIEYLEWHVERDATATITKVTFATETPEYWTAARRRPTGSGASRCTASSSTPPSRRPTCSPAAATTRATGGTPPTGSCTTSCGSTR